MRGEGSSSKKDKKSKAAEKEAAKEFCDCYEVMMAAQEKAGNSENTTDLFSAQSELAEEAKKAILAGEKSPIYYFFVKHLMVGIYIVF